jgi:hypothetical protein
MRLVSLALFCAWLLNHSGVHIRMRPGLSANSRGVSFVLCSPFFILTSCLSYIVPVIQRGVGASIDGVHIYEKLGVIEDLQLHCYKCLQVETIHAHYYIPQLLDLARRHVGSDTKHGVRSILLFPAYPIGYDLFEIIHQIVNHDYSRTNWPSSFRYTH